MRTFPFIFIPLHIFYSSFPLLYEDSHHDFPYYHPDSPHSHTDYPHSHPDSPHFHHSFPDSPSRLLQTGINFTIFYFPRCTSTLGRNTTGYRKTDGRSTGIWSLFYCKFNNLKANV